MYVLLQITPPFFVSPPHFHVNKRTERTELSEPTEPSISISSSSALPSLLPSSRH